MNGGPIHILMMEDDEGDAELARQGLLRGRIANRLDVVPDGQKGMSYLRREGDYAQMPRPDLILLDLNMPRMNGRAVLSELKADPNLRQIPVVVLTTSEAERDVLEAYDLHANAYMTKPVDFDNFVAVVRSIGNYWFTVVKLPPKPDPE